MELGLEQEWDAGLLSSVKIAAANTCRWPVFLKSLVEEAVGGVRPGRYFSGVFLQAHTLQCSRLLVSSETWH